MPNCLMLRKSLLSFAGIFLLAAAVLAAGIPLLYFRCNVEGTEALLEWEVSTENDLVRFDLYRKLDAEPGYNKQVSITPNGLRRYTYTDDHLFRTTPNANGIFYKLVVVSTREETAYFLSAVHNPSAVQRSWGSIKSMFR